MIKYQLTCADDHQFEGWFRNSTDYEDQAEKGLLECPLCGSDAVRRAIMAPAIARGRGNDVSASTGRPITPDPAKLDQIRQDLAQAATRARQYVEKNFENVGADFPEEARKIHYGESEERGIYGRASGEDVRELIEEGVEIAPLPGRDTSDRALGQPQPKKEVVKKDKTRDLS